jgi:hypothetical protein
MAYRVYDTEQKEWVKHNVYLHPNGELFLIKQSMLGWVKVPLELSDDRYIYHRSIDLYDKNQNLVYEGDYIKANVAEDKNVVGLACFAHELSAYIILCVDSDEFYTLGSNVSSEIEIIGNVYDGYKLNDND